MLFFQVELRFIDDPDNESIRQVLSVTTNPCLSIQDDGFFSNQQTFVYLKYVIFLFSVYYVIENALKIWALKWKFYVRSYLKLADGIISFTFFVRSFTFFAINVFSQMMLK